MGSNLVTRAVNSHLGLVVTTSAMLSALPRDPVVPNLRFGTTGPDPGHVSVSNT